MRRIVQTVTGAATGATIEINFNNAVVGIGFACVVAGTVNYTVNHTYDDVFAAVPPTWFPHGVANMVNATSNQESNFIIPISGMQLVINSGTGSVTITILQQGIRG